MVISILVMILCIVLYRRKCERQKKKYYDAFSKQAEYYRKINDPSCAKLDAMTSRFDTILERAYSSLRTYHNYQFITKIFGASSLIFSAMALSEESNLYEHLGCRICSLISIISVIVLLYINPLDRARGYLNVWRMWNEYFITVSTALFESIDKCEEELKKHPEKIKEELSCLQINET